MGKIIDTLTTMFMQPSQPQPETTNTVHQHSQAKFPRKACRIFRPPQEVEGDFGFSHASETELNDRKILKIRRKKDEEETIESETAAATSTKEAERRREWAEGKAR